MAEVKGEVLQGTFCIGVDSRISARLVLETILTLNPEYPKLKLQIEYIRNRKDALRKLVGGQVLGCMIHVDYGERESFCQKIRLADLLAERMIDSELVFVVRSEHPLANRETVKLEEMLQYLYATVYTMEELCQSGRYQLFKAHNYQQETIFSMILWKLSILC